MDDGHALPLEMLTDDDLAELDALLDDPSATGPGGYAVVAELLGAARRPASGEDLVGESVAMAAFVEHGKRSRARARGRRVGTGIATAAVTLALGSGLAAAGSLPGAVQDAASSVFAAVGIDVPSADEVAPDRPTGDAPGGSPGRTQDGHDPQGSGTPPLVVPGSASPTGEAPGLSGGAPDTSPPGGKPSSSPGGTGTNSSGGRAPATKPDVPKPDPPGKPPGTPGVGSSRSK